MQTFIKQISCFIVVIFLSGVTGCGKGNESGNNNDKKSGVKFLQAAADGNIEEIKKHIGDGIDVNIQSTDGNTALWFASRNGQVEVVKYLLEQKANPEIAGVEGFKPLHNVSNPQITKLLLEAGANPNVKSNAYISPLLLSLGEDSLETLTLLLQHKADPDIEDKAGSTPLFQAATLGLVEGAKLLIKAGANVNKTNMVEETPLFMAVRLGNIEFVKLLKKSGVNLKQKNITGQTVLSATSDPEMIKLLK